MKSFRCSLKDSLCLLLGSEVNAITWLVFLTLHRNQSGCSFSHPHCPPPPRGVMQTEAALPPRHPGDITALVKQKRNPACGSCSLKKISAVRPHRGKYISIWLKVAFIVKYVGGKKMFFYTVSFPSAVWCFSRMPWSWVPDIYFARENLLRTCLWTSNAVLRARESETEGGREKKTLPHCGTPEALHARTHPCNSLPTELSHETSRSQRPVDASVLQEKAGTLKPHSFPPGCLAPGLALLWPPAHPLTDTRGKKHMHQSLAQHQL